MGKKLGNLIRAARTDAGLTQTQLAKKVPGTTQAQIGRFERGEAEPTTQVVKDIAKACGVTQKSLLDAMPKVSRTSGTSSASKPASGSKPGSGSKPSAAKPANTTKPASASKPSTAQKSSMQVTATEKRLVELYRQADTETRKKALAILRGKDPDAPNATDGIDVNDIISGIGGLIGDMLSAR